MRLKTLLYKRNRWLLAAARCNGSWVGQCFSCLLGLAIWMALALHPLAAQYGDAEAGAETLRERQCTACHSVAGVGGDKSAPDLGRRSVRDFMPSTMAAMMWNHGPTMWKAMEARNLPVPDLTPLEVVDLYSYFFSLRYFEPPGDAARGKAVFVSKKCDRCHALVATEAGAPAPAVPQWPALSDAVLWVQNMWNHGGNMAAQLENEGIPWPQFTVQEMADLMVYLRHLPAVSERKPTFRFGDSQAGADVLESHNCLECHTFGVSVPAMVDLAAVSRREGTLTGLAVAMWNHRPIMTEAAKKRGLEIREFQSEEMRQLVAYLFEEHYFDAPGEAEDGRKAFGTKGCDSCHGQPGTGAPTLRGTGGGFTVPTLASAVWRHGPAMLARMEQRGVKWPTLTDRDIMNLIAYLNAN